MVRVNEILLKEITELAKDGSVTVDCNNARLINTGYPTSDDDAVTKSYIDGIPFSATLSAGSTQTAVYSYTLNSNYEADIEFNMKALASTNNLSYRFRSLFRNPSGTTTELLSFREETKISDVVSYNPNVLKIGNIIYLNITADPSNITLVQGRVLIKLTQLS